MKLFVALARVSSERQKREGFSLEDQEAKLHELAGRHGGTIFKLFKIAETASKRDERTTFREMLAFAKKYAKRLKGILFVKVDRAMRNLADWVELERLESEWNIPLIFPDQPSGETPSGRGHRRFSAVMATMQVEQQAHDIRAGHQRRIESGLPLGAAPYGYRNVRINGRSIIEIDEKDSPKVKRIFELYAYQPVTLDSLVDLLARQGIVYTDRTPKFARSTLQRMLNNRHYLGEVLYQGTWRPGSFEWLIDRATFTAAQDRMGGKVYHAHEMTFAGSRIVCDHCGHVITGEKKTKQTPSGATRTYTYYRCSKYSAPNHPRCRVTEAELNGQLLELFDRLRLEDQEMRDLFIEIIRARAHASQAASADHREELKRLRDAADQKMKRLLDMRLDNEISADDFAKKRTELEEHRAGLLLQLETLDRDSSETTALAVKSFELSQNLKEKWLAADYAAKRTILEIVCSEMRLNRGKLTIFLRKPFDLLAEGVVLETNGAMGI
jgi:site-specific DNA recombinase